MSDSLYRQMVIAHDNVWKFGNLRHHHFCSIVRLSCKILARVMLNGESTESYTNQQRLTILRITCCSLRRMQPHYVLLASQVHDLMLNGIYEAIRTSISLLEDRLPATSYVEHATRLATDALHGTLAMELNLCIDLCFINILNLLKEIKYILERNSQLQDVYDQSSIRSYPFTDTTYLYYESRRLYKQEYFTDFEVPIFYEHSERYVKYALANVEDLEGLKENLITLEEFLNRNGYKTSNYAKFTLKQVIEVFAYMYKFCLTVLMYTDNYEVTLHDCVSQKIFNGMNSFVSFLLRAPLGPILAPSNMLTVRASLYDLNFIIRGLIQGNIFSLILADYLQRLKTANNILINMFMRQNNHLSEVPQREEIHIVPDIIDDEVFMDSDDVENRCTLQADEIPEETVESWKVKFSEMKNMEEVLAKCGENVCFICYNPLHEIFPDDDVAVVPGCVHVPCLSCMQQCVIKSPSE